MPDDEKVTEQTEEEKPDEAEGAFAEEVEEEEEKKATEEAAPAKKEEKKEEEPPEKKAEKKAEEPEKKPEEKKEKPLDKMTGDELKKVADEFPDLDTSNMTKEEAIEAITKAREAKAEEEPPKTAKDRLDKRLEELGEEEEPEPQKKEETEPEKKVEEGEPEKKAVFTKEDIAERLQFLSHDELPEQMVIGDLEINVKEYAERYPEEFGIIKVASSAIAQKMIEKAVGGIETLKAEDVDEKIRGAVKEVLSQVSYERLVLEKHTDAMTIIYGSGKEEFHKWLEKQSERTKDLARSTDPEDGILILDYYKEDTAKKKTAEFDKKAKDKKKEHDDIHLSTERSKKTIVDRGIEYTPGRGEEEAEAAFNEG